jgi:DNA invertase Pin-like site-specific DNA recombinase
MKAIAYYRISTKRQANEGYGIEAQRKAVNNYLEHRPDYELLAEYKEVESGTNPNRKKLKTALRRCRQHKAVLVIAKLDRLTRSLPMLMELENSGVDFECVELGGFDKTTIRLLVTVAEREVELIRKRTKEGLEIAKAKGKKLGNPQLRQGVVLGTAKSAKIAREARSKIAREWAKDYLPDLESAEQRAKQQKVNPTLQYIADYFNAEGLVTRKGKVWTTRSVQLLKKHRDSISANSI